MTLPREETGRLWVQALVGTLVIMGYCSQAVADRRQVYLYLPNVNMNSHSRTKDYEDGTSLIGTVTGLDLCG